jgi:hypothetical protein
MSILSLPSVAAFSSARVKLRTNTLTHTSDLDRTTQTVELSGAMWTLELPLVDLGDSDAAIMRAFLAELDGPAGRFYASDPRRLVPLGSAATTPGTPKVAGAGQTGKTIDVDGMPVTTAGYLLKGDHFAFDVPSGLRTMHILTADVDTDSTGAATFSFRPALRESPADNASLLISPASAVFRLIDDEQAAWDEAVGGFHSMSISAVEAFDAG